MRNCTWAALIAWAGPLYPTASTPLTRTIVAAGLSTALRSAIVDVVGLGGAAVGNVTALVEDASVSSKGGVNGEDERRRRNESFVEEGMVVIEGSSVDSVWLRIETQLLPEAEQSARALLPLHVGNLTGAFGVLAPQGLSMTLTANTRTPEQPRGSKGSSAGVAAGAALACLTCIVVIAVIVYRRKSKRFSASSGHADGPGRIGTGGVQGHSGASDNPPAGWLYENPAYLSSSERSQGSSAPKHDGLQDNPAYVSSPAPRRDLAALPPDGMRDNPAYVSAAAEVPQRSDAEYAETDLAATNGATYSTPLGAIYSTPFFATVATDDVTSPGQAEQGECHDAQDPHDDHSVRYMHLANSASAEYAEPMHVHAGQSMALSAASEISSGGARQGTGAVLYTAVPASAVGHDAGANSTLASRGSVRERTGGAQLPDALIDASKVWLFLRIVTGCGLKMSSTQAAALVTADGAGQGTFLVRWSTRGKGLTLTFNTGHSAVHELITFTPAGQPVLCGRASRSLLELLELHQSKSVGKSGAVLHEVAPAIERAALAALKTVMGKDGLAQRHPGAAVDAITGRPVGSAWRMSAVSAVAAAMAASGVAAEVCALPAHAAGAVDLDGLLWDCVCGRVDGDRGGGRAEHQSYSDV